MKTAGLISSQACIHFRSWHVEYGPTEWDDRDVWQEIDDDLKKNNVRSAAALLRYYLEYVSAEICHRLRVPVEFRGDAQFQLGDLLTPAASRFRKLLAEGRNAAESWDQKAAAMRIGAQESEFSARVAKSNVEQWQINPAVHYNEWANLQPADFAPVVTAFRELLESFMCPSCRGFLYVIPERGERHELRCPCGAVPINLKRR
jgi:hypothetical protein